MRIDPRGGHNKKFVNYNFFKTWSTNMAYVLGFIYADGAIEDVRKSSRTCYLAIGIKDRDLLKDIRRAMSSKHKIYVKEAQFHSFPGNKTYYSKRLYVLRIGSKAIFEDLVNLGLKPRKSLDIKFPLVPKDYIKHFIRGYFDGDGCINLYYRKNCHIPRITVIFTSGSKVFLNDLNKIICVATKTSKNEPFFQGRAYRLKYNKGDSLKLLNFIYKETSDSIFLKRKYDLYQKYLAYNI